MEQDDIDQLWDWVRGRYFGKYRGTVENNADDTKRGRLQVKVPAVLGDLKVWAMPCVPYAGNKVGYYCLPDKGTGVWVEFEGGDPSYPIWTGFFWADNELPDKSDANIKIWKTETMTVRLDDSAKEALIEAKDGAKLTVAAEVKSESGQITHTVSNSSVVSQAGSGKVEVTQTAVKVNDGALEVM
jgi:uncharacterized protein involved in type VI secretion and phage assembly